MQIGIDSFIATLADPVERLHVHWSGKHRAPLTGQAVYPRPVQNPLPVWIGVGGTPASFARAGALGLAPRFSNEAGGPDIHWRGTSKEYFLGIPAFTKIWESMH